MSYEHQPLFKKIEQLPSLPLAEQEQLLADRKAQYQKITDNLLWNRHPNAQSHMPGILRTLRLVDLRIKSLGIATQDAIAVQTEPEKPYLEKRFETSIRRA